MPKIVGVKKSRQKRQNIFQQTLAWLLSLNAFSKAAIIVFILLLISIPFVTGVNNFQSIFNFASGISPTPNVAQSPFVTAQGRNLYLNGKLFRWVGVNRYNLLTYQYNFRTRRGCGDTFTQSDIDTEFSQLHNMGITVVRFWAYQNQTQAGTDFSRFDYVLSEAQKYGMYVIPTLEGQQDNCTMSGFKYDTWYSNGYLSPYADKGVSYTPLSYPDYIKIVINRYKDNPNILMWQMMNEAQSKSTANVEDPTALYNWTKAMSSYIKSLDSNHLVSLGTQGNNVPGTEDPYYTQLHALSTVDVLEYHDYRHDSQAIPDALQERINDSISLNKPLFIGEAGIWADTNGNCTVGATLNNNYCYTQDQRYSLFKAKMQAAFQNGIVGYTIWTYQNPTGGNQSEPFIFMSSDPLSSLVQKSNLQLTTIDSATPTL